MLTQKSRTKRYRIMM